MRFNLNEFLMAISFALDFVEIDLLGVSSNHGKRVAYISLKLAEKLGMTPEEKHDIIALAILHDNGASERALYETLQCRDMENINVLENRKQHCIIGERNIKNYPFLTEVSNVILYHHEKYNGQGFFNLQGEEIPLMSQIIGFADTIELNFDLKNHRTDIQKEVMSFVQEQAHRSFSPQIVEAFIEVSKNKSFWLDLRDQYINIVLRRIIPHYSIELSFEEIRHITQVLSKIIDAKSRYTQTHSRQLAEKVLKMAEFYQLDQEEKLKLAIAADLHDIGKLAVSNKILDSSSKLSLDDFEIIKEHPYYTGIVLREMQGFEEIAAWACNHHERLDGTGYPNGLDAETLDFGSRLIACLDVYQALTEERPYRKALSHRETLEIMNRMKESGSLDRNIIHDIEVFLAPAESC